MLLKETNNNKIDCRMSIENYVKNSKIYVKQLNNYSDEVRKSHVYLITVEQLGFRGKDHPKIIF